VRRTRSKTKSYHETHAFCLGESGRGDPGPWNRRACLHSVSQILFAFDAANQKVILSALCTNRGPVLPMLLIVPKFPSPGFESGCPKLGVFSASKASKRNWI
jgi:hypothetical protein